MTQVRTYEPAPPMWCAGCGHFGVLNALEHALDELGISLDEVLVVADIGCSGTIQNSLGAYGYHALHGRVLPAAGGAALANPELTVIGAGGDGDGYAIGVGHLVHAFRRNVSLSDGSPQTCSTARRMRLRSSGRRRRPPSTPAQLRPRTRRSSTASRSEAARPPETPARAPGVRTRRQAGRRSGTWQL